VIDGEAVIVGADGVSDFFALHAAMARGAAPEAVLFAFDLLHLDGEDLRARPLAQRRALLAELLVGAGDHVHLSEHHVGEGPALLKAACDMGLEGIVAKRRDAPYGSGYVDSWRKVKCTTTEAFAVTGYDPAGRKGVRALKVSTLRGEELVPCGWVGSGLAGDTCQAIRSALDAGQHVVIDVEFRGWTPAGELRHAVFKGWHEG
jgi:bifunctional non-homologous end joining protein LigD